MADDAVRFEVFAAVGEEQRVGIDRCAASFQAGPDTEAAEEAAEEYAMQEQTAVGVQCRSDAAEDETLCAGLRDHDVLESRTGSEPQVGYRVRERFCIATERDEMLDDG